MADDFNNPSFETPGSEPGLALTWTPVVVSSLEEFAVFSRGDSVIVVDVLPAEDLLGVQIIENTDGTITLLVAVGSLTAFEDFEFAWDANQLYFFVFPGTSLEAATISGAKAVENLEDGWGEDDLFTVGPGATTTVIPTLEGGMVINAFTGYLIDIAGQQRTVLSNTATAFTLSSALSGAPTANLSIRVIGGETASELLSDITVLLTEAAGFDPTPEDFENFENKWGVDNLATLVSINAGFNILTVHETLVSGAFNGRAIDIAGQRRTIGTNTTNTITLTVAISGAPPVGAAIRIVGAGDVTAGFKDSLDSILFGSFDDSAVVPFTNGTQGGVGQYANDIKLRIFRSQPAPLLQFVAKDAFGFAFIPTPSLTYTIPPGTVIDPTGGTLIPAKLIPVLDAGTLLTSGVNDIVSAADLQPSGKYDIVGTPGTDVDRYQFTTTGLPTGREAFEQGWRVDALFGTAIADLVGDFVLSGFDRVELGQVEFFPSSSTYTPGDVTTPAIGVEIVLAVQEGGLEGTNPAPSASVFFLDKNSVPATVSTLLLPLLPPEGFEIILPVGPDGIISLTPLGASIFGYTSGVIAILAPTQLVEDFEDNWPPPSPELL